MERRALWIGVRVVAVAVAADVVIVVGHDASPAGAVVGAFRVCFGSVDFVVDDNLFDDGDFLLDVVAFDFVQMAVADVDGGVDVVVAVRPAPPSR